MYYLNHCDRYYLSPDGKWFDSKIQALKYINGEDCKILTREIN